MVARDLFSARDPVSVCTCLFVYKGINMPCTVYDTNMSCNNRCNMYCSMLTYFNMKVCICSSTCMHMTSTCMHMYLDMYAYVLRHEGALRSVLKQKQTLFLYQVDLISNMSLLPLDVTIHEYVLHFVVTHLFIIIINKWYMSCSTHASVCRLKHGT